MSIKSILITGSTGFLGNIFYKHFKKTYKVSELDKPDGISTIRLNEEVPKFHSYFDLVIHAAGKAHIMNNEINHNMMYDVNVGGTLNLLKGLENSFLPRSFVFISSVSVYGLDNGINISEHQPLNAKDVYGRSKIDAEKAVSDWCEKHSVICTILRLPLIVGYDPPGNLRAMINSIRRGYYFNIDGGHTRKSMVLADDVASIISNVSNIGGVYNLTDGYHPSFYEISSHIASQLNKRKPSNIPRSLALVIAKVGDLIGAKAPINTIKFKKMTTDLTFDDSKAVIEIGWKPTPILECFNIIKP